MKALVVKNIEVEASPGCTIGEAVKEAQELSAEFDGVPIFFEFNGLRMKVSMTDQPETVERDYHRRMKAMADAREGVGYVGGMAP